MISYPKRTIIQNKIKHQEVSPPAKKVNVKQSVINSTDPYDKLGKAPTRWADILYPSKLYWLHLDLDVVRDGNLSKADAEEIYKRIPFDAEKRANRMLSAFVNPRISGGGSDKYKLDMQEALSHNSRLMMIYRCFVACMDSESVDDVIRIFKNEAMNSWDFFPKDSIRVDEDDESILVDYVDDGYSRSECVRSVKHYNYRSVNSVYNKSCSDRLPPEFLKRIVESLYFHNAEIPSNVAEAWRFHNNISDKSSIEERIIARIAYLMLNASSYDNNTKLLK